MITWLGIASADHHGTCALPRTQVLSHARISSNGALRLGQLKEGSLSSRQQRIDHHPMRLCRMPASLVLPGHFCELSPLTRGLIIS
jgi:hypothetical protein